MIGLAVGGALVAAGAGVGAIGLLLAKRVVNAEARTKRIRVHLAEGVVSLPEDEKTTAAGEYLLTLVDGTVLRVGDVIDVVDDRVRRQVLSDTSGLPIGETQASWSAHGYASPGDVADYSTVQVPLANGERREAWLFAGDPEHWVIHVQGVRTTRGVTLRTVAVAHEAGATSLAITYRGAGDGPPARSATLGSREWVELQDSISYARDNGAKRVTVVAWSMGAALAFELLRRHPDAVDDLVLMCPVSSWPKTIEYGAQRAHLPKQAAALASWLLRSWVGAKLLGLPAPIDVRSLEWTTPGSLPVPTMIVHSQGDEVVPWHTTLELVLGNPEVMLVETVACPHGFELTVPDPVTRARLHTWLISQ